MPENTFDFGAALQHLTNGNLVQRSGWNGKGMFIFMRPEDVLTSDVVGKLKSLPQRVRQYFENIESKNGKPFDVKVTSYLCMKAADGTIVNGWLASQTDMLADDWQIFNP